MNLKCRHILGCSLNWVFTNCHSASDFSYTTIPFTLSFWNGLFRKSLHLETYTAAKRLTIVNQEQNDKHCRSWWAGTLWAVSAGSTLYAKNICLVGPRAERVEWIFWHSNRLKIIYVPTPPPNPHPAQKHTGTLDNWPGLGLPSLRP